MTEKTYENIFPYQILGWEETYQNASEALTTKATLMKQIKSAYWNQHNLADTALRKELNLE